MMSTSRNLPRKLTIISQESLSAPSASPQTDTFRKPTDALRIHTGQPAPIAAEAPPRPTVQSAGASAPRAFTADSHSPASGAQTNLQQQIQNTQSDIAALQNQLRCAEQEKAALLARLTTATDSLKQTRSSLSSTEGQLQSAQAQLRSTQTQLQSAQAQLSAAQAERDRLLQEKHAAAHEATDLQATLDQDRQRLAELQRQAGMTDAELLAAADALNARYAALAKKSAALHKDVDADQKTISEMRSCEFIPSGDLDALEQDYEEISTRVEQLIVRLRHISIDAAHVSDQRSNDLNQGDKREGGTS